jgi:hypothetical protein
VREPLASDGARDIVIPMAGAADPGADSFRDIEFGFADARKEGAEAPELLIRGFFDDSGMTEEALSGSSFLFLGYKGSGKTALAERARLLGERDPSLFVTTASLEEFSYGDFKSLAEGAGEAHARYPTVWAWLLLLTLIQSLERDEQGRVDAPSTYRSTLKGLQRLSLLPLPQLNQLVSSSSRRGFKAAIPKFFEFTEERVAETPDLQLVQMVRLLRDAVLEFPTTSRHVLFIDGLDEILTQEQLQFEALAALISQASKLNDELRAAGKPFKVVVVCRTDIFDRLPGANKNKIRRDSSEALEWFDDPRDPDRTRLVQLVNLRAQRSLTRELNVFDVFFPPTVDQRPVRRVLLEHTRHLPRDVLQLMKSMQRFAPPAAGRMSEDQVRSGIRDYSNDYFLPELRDELHGYLDSAAIDMSIKLLASLGSPRFTMDDLERQADRLNVGSVDLDVLARTLFECSGIGMIDDSGSGRPVVTFKYRNRTAMLIPGNRMLVHPGAWKALNIQPRRSAPARARGRRRAARGPQGR